MVLGTDCIGSCKSNYHTITTTTTPIRNRKNALVCEILQQIINIYISSTDNITCMCYIIKHLHYIFQKQNIECKDLDVNKYKRLSNITLWRKLKLATEQCFYCCSTPHSPGMIFSNDIYSYSKMSVKRSPILQFRGILYLYIFSDWHHHISTLTWRKPANGLIAEEINFYH